MNTFTFDIRELRASLVSLKLGDVRFGKRKSFLSLERQLKMCLFLDLSLLLIASNAN